MQQNTQKGMTEVMKEYALRKQPLSLEEVKKVLRAEAYIRKVSEVLMRYFGVDGSNIHKTVTDKLCETCGGKANRDSIAHKVRDWLTKKKTSIDKESAVQLVFALKLSVSDAEELLCRLSGENFHWRDPDDIVLMFALNSGMLYCDALALLDRMRPLYEAVPPAEDSNMMTETIKLKVEQIQTEEDLKNFFIEEASKLGKMHNTAYSLYKDFMHLLSDNGDMLVSGEKRKKNSDEDEDTIIEETEIASNILNTYLHRNAVPIISNKADRVLQDAIQRSIKQNWPDKYILSRINKRKIDVSRKVLILLFLATDGGETVYGDLSDEDSDEDIFQDTYRRLSKILSDCGFPKLDARNPFDWMVLYCIASARDIIDIDQNIEDFLSAVFDTAD